MSGAQDNSVESGMTYGDFTARLAKENEFFAKHIVDQESLIRVQYYLITRYSTTKDKELF